MIDLHSHLLPGIDDGAPDMEASVAMGRAAVAGGVDAIVATPHVSLMYRNDPLTFGERVAQVQAALDAADVELRVHKGAELSHAMLLELSDESLAACVLGDGDFILFEPPLNGPVPFIDRMVSDLQQKGFKVLIAHPERIGAFQRRIDLVDKLVVQGCLTSVTAGSVAGQFGGTVKRFTQELFARGLVHNLASDAHDAEWRSPALRPTLEQAVAELPELEGRLDYLTVEVPQAILAGEAPRGDPPVIEPKRGLLGRLRRR
ncbi:MAG TPA: CpsB/CapC family capsule biosynthesis tyrosine phosphatase [Thermoleophilaceae bacterium]